MLGVPTQGIYSTLRIKINYVLSFLSYQLIEITFKKSKKKIYVEKM